MRHSVENYIIFILLFSVNCIILYPKYFSYGENGIFVEQSLYNLHSDLFVTKPFLLHYCQSELIGHTLPNNQTFSYYILCTTLQRMTRILVFMPNFCHFMLSKSKRVSNGLRSVDKEQVFFYPHLIAYFLYKQRKNFCFPQQIVSICLQRKYGEVGRKLVDSKLVYRFLVFINQGIMLGPQ